MIKEKFISAVIGTLFFAVFQPFGMSTFGVLDRVLVTLGLLVVAFASCLTCEYIIRYVLRMPFDTGRGPSYMMKRGIVFQICNVIVLTVYMSLYFDRFLNNDQVDNHLCLQNSFGIFVASVGCCLFIGLYWRTVYWKRYYAKQLEEAQMLNGVLMERARQSAESVKRSMESVVTCVSDERITLEGSTKESVSLHPADFLFAESEGNYVSVYHIEGGEVKRTMLRTSMKNVVAELSGYNDIMQCHRAFVVNLSHVESVEGRSSGIGLKLRQCDVVVPVSKGYVSEVKERIKNPV